MCCRETRARKSCSRSDCKTLGFFYDKLYDQEKKILITSSRQIDEFKTFFIILYRYYLYIDNNLSKNKLMKNK